MGTLRSKFVVLALCAMALAALPGLSRAEDAAPAAPAAEGQPAEKADMPGCMKDGAPCCAECQGKGTQAKPAEGEPAGAAAEECPCQRAKRLKQGS